MNNYELANTENTKYDLTIDGETDFVADLTSKTASYCSIKAENPEDQAKIFNAMNGSDAKRIKDCINQVISVSDVYVESVMCSNEQTGETKACPRVVLISEDGSAYQAVSTGIFSALKKLFRVYGEPMNWKEPINIKIKQISSGTKNILTFDVVL